MGWFHIPVLKEVMELVAFEDFVLASSPCESASLVVSICGQILLGITQPACSGKLWPPARAGKQDVFGAGCQVMCKKFPQMTLPKQLLTLHIAAA